MPLVVHDVLSVPPIAMCAWLTEAVSTCGPAAVVNVNWLDQVPPVVLLLARTSQTYGVPAVRAVEGVNDVVFPTGRLITRLELLPGSAVPVGNAAASVATRMR